MAKELGRVETFDSPDIINTDTGTTTKLSVPVSMILYFMLFFTTLLQLSEKTKKLNPQILV